MLFPFNSVACSSITLWTTIQRTARMELRATSQFANFGTSVIPVATPRLNGILYLSQEVFYWGED